MFEVWKIEKKEQLKENSSTYKKQKKVIKFITVINTLPLKKSKVLISKTKKLPFFALEKIITVKILGLKKGLNKTMKIGKVNKKI